MWCICQKPLARHTLLLQLWLCTYREVDNKILSCCFWTFLVNSQDIFALHWLKYWSWVVAPEKSLIMGVRRTVTCRSYRKTLRKVQKAWYQFRTLVDIFVSLRCHLVFYVKLNVDYQEGVNLLKVTGHLFYNLVSCAKIRELEVLLNMVLTHPLLKSWRALVIPTTPPPIIRIRGTLRELYRFKKKKTQLSKTKTKSELKFGGLKQFER